jgi:predicted ATP-binding protein involved in virulence
MKLNQIEIKQLFGLFTYTIPVKNGDNLVILTGPNGFGKTMILNIIYSFFSKKFSFFHRLAFEKITLWFDQDVRIEITKGDERVSYLILQNGEVVDQLNYVKTEGSVRAIERNIPHIRRVEEDKWLDVTTDKILNFEDVLQEYSYMLPENIRDRYLNVNTKNPIVNEVINSIKVHLIKEQRLIRILPRNEKATSWSSVERDRNYMTDTIREYAKELQDMIGFTLKRSFETSQELDSSFPKRLLSETNKLTIDEFNKRFNFLRLKQEKLKKYSLSESEQEVPSFNEADAKVLLVYLNDTEKKLSVFDDLLSKLELFTNILNQRRFTYKSIKIDKEKGFYFQTQTGQDLLLTDLSSGEQHEVVLLFELIFKANINTLVLIDEPEISLHITWQKEFLNDLLRIIELQKMQVIIATHSPQIINERWDLVYNLESKKQAQSA